MDEAKWQKWFEEIWADREERLYRQFFGDIGPGIYPIPVETFKSIGREDPDPRWLTHGVFECPPSASRPHWVYVTSAMSNPWGDSPETVNPENYSGLGCEFTLHTPERGKWAIQILHWVMAVQLLLACGELKGELLNYHDRVPLGGPLAKKDGLLTHLLVAQPPPPPLGYPSTFTLASGKVDFMLLIGITTRERDFAKTQDSPALLKLLEHHQIFPLTDPGRASLV